MSSVLTHLPLLTSGRELSQARAAVILMHGRARAAEEMIAISARFGLRDLAYLAPTAAGASWYPQSFLAPLAANQPQLDTALANLEAMVCALEEHGFARERVALVGFSQGACLLAEYVYRHPARWGALVAFTGGVIGPPGPVREPSGELRGTPVFLGTSEGDTWVPLARVQETAELFGRMGGVVELRVEAGGEHVVTEEQVAAAGEVLRGVG